MEERKAQNMYSLRSQRQAIRHGDQCHTGR